MRRGILGFGGLLLLAACDSGAGGTETRAGEDAAPAPPAPPAEDAFVLPDARRVDATARDMAGADADPGDGTTPTDATAGDAAVADAGAAPVPPAGGLAAGAGPLRSPRYRLYAVVGPAEAAGSALSSPLYRLESGPTQWVSPPAEPAR